MATFNPNAYLAPNMEAAEDALFPSSAPTTQPAKDRLAGLNNAVGRGVVGMGLQKASGALAARPMWQAAAANQALAGKQGLTFSHFSQGGLAPIFKQGGKFAKTPAGVAKISPQQFARGQQFAAQAAKNAKLGKLVRAGMFLKGLPAGVATYEAVAAPVKSMFNFRHENESLSDYSKDGMHGESGKRMQSVVNGKAKGVGDYADSGYSKLLKEGMYGTGDTKFPSGLLGGAERAVRGLGSFGQGTKALYHTLGGALGYALTGDRSTLVDPTDPNNWKVTERGQMFDPKGFRHDDAGRFEERMQGLRDSLTPEDIKSLREQALLPETDASGERARRMLNELVGEDAPEAAETMSDMPEDYQLSAENMFEMPELAAEGDMQEGATTNTRQPEALKSGEYRIAAIDPQTGRPIRVGAGVGSQATGPMSRERGQDLIAGGGRQGQANRVVLSDMRKWQANDRDRVQALRDKVDVRLANGTVVSGEKIAQMPPLQRERFLSGNKGAALVEKSALPEELAPGIQGQLNLGMAQERLARNTRGIQSNRFKESGEGPTAKERLVLAEARNSNNTRTLKRAEEIRRKYAQGGVGNAAKATEAAAAQRQANFEAKLKNDLDVAKAQASRYDTGRTREGIPYAQAEQQARMQQVLDAIGLLPEDSEEREQLVAELINSLGNTTVGTPQGGI